MNSWRFIQRSLTYHWRTHIGVALGAAVATAALTGALVVGDSVRATLRHIALNRLGDTQHAMAAGDRYFTQQSIARLPADGNDRVIVALDVAGVASVPGSGRRLAGLRVLGVAPDFVRTLTGREHEPFSEAMKSGSVALNGRLAEQLGVGVGDSLVLRVAKPSALSPEIPIGSQTDGSVSLRLRVGTILGGGELGDFNLKNEQLPPLNAFVPLGLLQSEMGLVGRVNLALTTSNRTTTPDLSAAWSLADVQSQLVHRESLGVVELASDRVFLDPPLASAAEQISGSQKSVTYFVNELSHGGRATPYSMVSAFDPAQSDLLPDDLAQDEMVITEWLAEDLGISVGQTVGIRYFVTGQARQMTERRAEFRVRGVVPTEPPGGDRRLMPAFEGLSDATSPLNWQAPPEMNIELDRIRKKDEQYWEDHRGAPKAFVGLAWAEKNWSTRFGTYTTVRWPSGVTPLDQIERQLLDKLDPASFGLRFADVRTPALAAASQGHDFGQLFIGFSFFLVFASLMLTALMFAFGIEHRTPQVGAMLAMGFTPRHVRRVMLGEGAVLALIGSWVGLPLGLLYTRTVLWALVNLWQGATGLGSLRFAWQPLSLLIGFFAGLVMAVLVMLWVLRRQGGRPVRQLLAARYGIETPPLGGRKIACSVGVLAVVAAIALGATADRQHAAAAFFGAGALLLVGGLAFCAGLLKQPRPQSGAHLSWVNLGWRTTARRRGRSLATVTMLACGTFLLVAINAFRHDPGHAPESATLGYELFATTALPVYHDLNSPTGRDHFGLTEREMRGVTITPMRLLEGDDASCLNLNRPQAPPLLGVSPARFNHPLAAVLRESGGAELSALVDDAVAQWVIKKKVGDMLPYINDKGQDVAVRIVGLLPKTIMQGYLLVDETRFIEHFPDHQGYRVFLIDAPPDRVEEVRKAMDFALADVGFVSQTTAERLAAFNAVENTYLSIFGILGGLGVLVGCFGLGLVVLRNVLERRAELAAMTAMGFRAADLRRLLLAEHWALIVMGLACGLVSALVAIAPSLRTAGRGLPYRTLLVTLGAIAVAALAWTAIAAALALRGRLTRSLRSE